MNTGNLLVRIGFGLLFVWEALEKIIATFSGVVGFQNNIDYFLKASGLAFLGDTAIYIAGALLVALELISNVLVERHNTYSAYDRVGQTGL